ncbi:hypothetical protein DFJ77DRAFT_472227 [Powellomyces hirtus]|nr:hypothetical protein DFJ77DRAFT_472227 [Powellomyces hirtus]
MPIPVNSVIPLEAGSIVCGIVLTLLVLGIAQHGVSLKVIADSDRQRFLNVVCLSVVIAGIISLGLNQTLDVFILQNVCLMVIFWGVQLGLCCLNHNTLMRLYITYTRQRGGVKRASQWCLLLYPLSAIVLIPIYLAYPQTLHLEEGVNRAEINARVYKPLNVGLVFATELLATVSDVLLLRRINIAADGTREAEVAALARRNLWKEYTVVWLSVVLDVLLKLLIFAGQPVLFDSQVTNLTLVLRARTNLKYGLTLHEMWCVPASTIISLPRRLLCFPIIFPLVDLTCHNQRNSDQVCSEQVIINNPRLNGIKSQELSGIVDAGTRRAILARSFRGARSA